jgi:tetratricopeptide (TPR) repeat protein
MQQITSGLTGDSPKDICYLREQGEKYKGLKIETEVKRAIGRLIYGLLPAEGKGKMGHALEDDAEHIESAMKEAEYLLEHGNPQKAVTILEPLISSVGSLYHDDAETEYRDFNNAVETTLYLNVYHPVKTVICPKINRSMMYLMYGYALVELNRLDDAKIALEMSIHFNPVNVHAIFEYSDLFKRNRSFQPMLKWTRRCLKYAYTPNDIAHVYRNFGYYYIEQQQYAKSAAMYYVSLCFEQNQQATSELFYITQMTGKKPTEPSSEEAENIFQQENIQYGPSELVVSILSKLAMQFEENGKTEEAKAHYQMLYKITRDEGTKQKLEQIDNNL